MKRQHIRSQWILYLIERKCFKWKSIEAIRFKVYIVFIENSRHWIYACSWCLYYIKSNTHAIYNNNTELQIQWSCGIIFLADKSASTATYIDNTRYLNFSPLPLTFHIHYVQIFIERAFSISHIISSLHSHQIYMFYIGSKMVFSVYNCLFNIQLNRSVFAPLLLLLYLYDCGVNISDAI